TSLSICVGGQLSYPPWLSISSVQFQPYRAGLATSPVRLAPNTTAIVTAMTATTEPARVASTGTGLRPAPRSSASRVPTTALTGRPAAAAAAATDDARAPGASPGGCADRQARLPRTASSATASTQPPPASTSGSTCTPRAGSNSLTAPTGASGETAIAPITASAVPPRTATAPASPQASAAWPR